MQDQVNATPCQIAGRCPSWVKLRRTHCEQMSSGLPLEADITQYCRHVSKVPQAEIILASLGWIHSALMFAALMIGHHFSTSAL